MDKPLPENAESPREAYETPELRRIKLVPGEVAVTGCKTMTSSGQGGSCLKSMCSGIGS